MISDLNEKITNAINQLETTVNTDFKADDKTLVTASDIHYLFKTVLETLSAINEEISKLS